MPRIGRCVRVESNQRRPLARFAALKQAHIGNAERSAAPSRVDATARWACPITRPGSRCTARQCPDIHGCPGGHAAARLAHQRGAARLRASCARLHQRDRRCDACRPDDLLRCDPKPARGAYGHLRPARGWRRSLRPDAAGSGRPSAPTPASPPLRRIAASSCCGSRAGCPDRRTPHTARRSPSALPRSPATWR